ncbi:hypothetical protein SAMN04490244_101358 [Tranquillimonas rosea]|uniref:Uncharacterized protein n=1 Tax=Tranquillimonas rosea TaxID=641238 RepID=A0A1H9PVZ1_9RHOB|nr:hypothetical protein [Tranquillimonas rosea]SER52288.1 hypothetical protein SAMN04490244_101358 [Tranquillimonas rosea]
MSGRYAETTARIVYPGEVSLNLGALAEPLVDRLRQKGYEFDVVGQAAGHELLFVSRSLIVTLSRPEEHSDTVCVSSETPRDAEDPSAATKMRFRACAAVVRHFVASQAASKIVWSHAGREYVTETGGERIAPCGGALQDKQADNRDNAPDLPDEQSVPLKLAIYTMNTSLMLVSLPVGAGMLTYNLLKGGSINATGRVMALTGLAIGASNIPSMPEMAFLGSLL